ncbi:tannase and feruloyl esterase-domain-containing protein [Aspergillus karnatakaensis]|uniref:tannase and feruloyl esterase-domain-containing protein n=1 Tax=Aspergillus karnatakaensis TaxID=1810916 RepID=UPI003CCDDD5E
MALQNLLIFLSLVPSITPAPIQDTSCSRLRIPSIPGAMVLRMTTAPVNNYNLPENPSSPPDNPQSATFCKVSIVLTHTGSDDIVYISTWLPSNRHWNGRYAATGGGGLAAGYDSNMVEPFLAGFATSSTDGGLTLNHTINPQSGVWGVNEDNSLNEVLMENIARRSTHDMAVASKNLIQQYYGTEAEYSYFVGCSQGGRQGYAAAAKYPADFDGILAIAPGLASDNAGPAAFWPIVVMHNEGEMVPPCVFEEFQGAIIKSCDWLDGIEDGLLNDYDLLRTCPIVFNAYELVGKEVDCPATGTITITNRHARIVRKILDGPRTSKGVRNWYGMAPGATFSGVANTTYSNGSWIPSPFATAAAWLQNMVVRDAEIDITKLSYRKYFEIYDKSIDIGARFVGDDYLDLSEFAQNGGKLLSWVGLADEYIPPLHLLDLHDILTAQFGNLAAVDEFLRVFTAPGVGHCKGGNGPQPVKPLSALVQWVEHGAAPETLPAQTVSAVGKNITRDLCLYPKKPVYLGGDMHVKGSFECQNPAANTSTPRDQEEDLVQEPVEDQGDVKEDTDQESPDANADNEDNTQNEEKAQSEEEEKYEFHGLSVKHKIMIAFSYLTVLLIMGVAAFTAYV